MVLIAQQYLLQLGQGAKVKVDPWSPHMMFTGQEIYENPPKNNENGTKMQKQPKMGQQLKEGPFFKKDSVKDFKKSLKLLIYIYEK